MLEYSLLFFSLPETKVDDLFAFRRDNERAGADDLAFDDVFPFLRDEFCVYGGKFRSSPPNGRDGGVLLFAQINF